MTFDELPTWISDRIKALGIEGRDFDGGTAEMELYFAMLSAEHKKRSMDMESIGKAIAIYQQQVLMSGAAMMMQAGMEGMNGKK